MPYSKAQIRRILNVGDTPLIAAKHRIPLAARVCETLIRRKTFAAEDRAAIEQFNMLKDFNRELRGKALDTAQRYRLNTLATNSETIMWRRECDQYFNARLPYIREQLARQALRTAGNVYLLSYYGRAWLMSSASKQQIHMPPPLNIKITGDVLQPTLEAFNPSEAIYDTLGVEWRQQFDDQLQDAARRMRGQTQLSIQNGESVLETLTRYATVLGVNGDGSTGTAGRLGTIVRSKVQSASVSGTTAIAEANSDAAVGVMFITSRLPNVCRICQGLDGERWPLGDPDIVYPVSGTHPGCRCGLLVLTADMAEWPIDDPPDLSWSEWLRQNNINFFADEFEGEAA